MDNIIQNFIYLAEHQTWFYLLTVCLVGLAIGSFLNVVIYRLPVMMQNEWRSECKILLADSLKSEDNNTTEPTTFNLATPASTCPSCKSKIKAWQNIPVISWLLLKGKCASCKNRISIRYPAIELLTAIASVSIALVFDVTEITFVYLLVTWALVALIFIDIDHMLLPDQITIPLLWFALIASVFGITIPPEQAIIGAAVGYLSFWSVYWLFKLATGKEGMGYGDFKLMAVFGALLGWQNLPMIILLSSVVGAVIGITLLAVQGKDKNTHIPFGPYIAIAGWVAMLWGEQITSAYYQLILA